MDLPIRFVTTPSGARIAYATIGEGPPLVWGPKWISHLERLWAHNWGPGHAPDALEDCEYVDFSPTEAFARVIAHIKAQ